MDVEIETLQFTRLNFLSYKDLKCHVLTRTTSLIQYASYVRNVLHAGIVLEKGNMQMYS